MRYPRSANPLLKWIFCAIISVGCIFPVLATDSEAGKQNQIFETLQIQLVKDGFNQKAINRMYQNTKVHLEIKTVSLYFRHREGKLNYDQFTSKNSIKKARKYINQHHVALNRAEKKYGVDKNAITAILLVETRLGRVVGNKSILNTLSTLAALSDKTVRNQVWKKMSRRSDLKRAKFDKWSDRKSRWAYKELKSYLKYVKRENMDPSDIYGSYAGALGVAQFMPSSIMAYAKDGNGDGRVNLFDHADAAASIASYLKNFGWHPGIGQKKAYKVIFRYNRSSYYVNTVLKIRRLLEG